MNEGVKEVSKEQEESAVKDSKSIIEEKRIICRNADLIWKSISIAIVIISLLYVFLLYPKMIFADNIVRMIIAVILLLAIAFCIYLLPLFLKVNTKYNAYAIAYKQAYLEPVFTKEFPAIDYKGFEKISPKEISESNMMKKAKSAVANDCIRGEHGGIEFARYDLELRYESKKAVADCVFVVCDIDHEMDSELQIVQNDFKIGGQTYPQPEEFLKLLTGNAGFDKKFSVYIKNQKDAQEFLKDSFLNKLQKMSFEGPVMISFEKRKVYLVIRRKKDCMEAPIYSKKNENRSRKEAEREVAIVKKWLEFLKEMA